MNVAGAALASRAAALVTALGALAGCEPSVEEKLAPVGGPARETLTRIDQVRLDLEKRPALARNGADAKGAMFEKYKAGGWPHTENGIAAVVYVDELDHLGERAELMPTDTGAGVLANCGAWAKHGTPAPDTTGRVSSIVHVDYIVHVLRDCARVTHVLVIRPLDYVEASPIRLDPPNATAKASYETCVPDAKTAIPGTRCVFDGAYMKAELHLYALEPLRHLGGFTVEAESRASDTFYSLEAFASSARDDVRSQLDRAIEDGMKQHLHGALYR